jgi:hypothetical protein
MAGYSSFFNVFRIKVEEILNNGHQSNELLMVFKSELLPIRDPRINIDFMIL